MKESRHTAVTRYPRWLLAVAIAVTACGGASSTPFNPPEAAVPTAECLVVPPALIDAINTGVVAGDHVSRASAVRSNDFVEVYFVAGEIDGPGIDGPGDVGVWATNSLTAGQGMIGGVDGHAHQFSDWGSFPDVSRTDHGYDEARACLGG